MLKHYNYFGNRIRTPVNCEVSATESGLLRKNREGSQLTFTGEEGEIP